jgi:hypothetical protein
MNMDPKIGRVSHVAFDRYTVIKLLGSIIVNRIDGKLTKVMANGFQRISGVQVIRAEGWGNCSRPGHLLALHERYGIWRGGYERGLGFLERCNVLPRRENAKVNKELAHLCRVDITTIQSKRLYYIAD